MQKPPDQDPFITATLLSSLMQERNPIRAITGDLSRMLHMLANFSKSREQAQTRIEQLQQQVDRMEVLINHANPKPTGNRFDKLR